MQEFADQSSIYPSPLRLVTLCRGKGYVLARLTASLVLAPVPKSCSGTVYADFLVAHSYVPCWP